MTTPTTTEAPAAAIHKLEAAKRSLAISQRAVSTALEATKRRRKAKTSKSAAKGVKTVKRHRRRKSAGKKH